MIQVIDYSNMEDGGFTVVSSKKKHKRCRISHEPLLRSAPSTFPSAATVDKTMEATLLQSINQHRETMLSDQLWIATRKLLTASQFEPSEIVCYGLGSMTHGHCTVASRTQFGFLLCLKELFSVSHLYLYDPVLTESDKTIINSFGIELLKTNEEGKRRVEKQTLFFMPRCPFELFNNLLEENQHQLSRIMLIGNRLLDLKTQMTDRSLEESYPAIIAALRSVQDVGLPCSDGELDCILNNTSIQMFL